jgi:hypothetical protein
MNVLIDFKSGMMDAVQYQLAAYVMLLRRIGHKYQHRAALKLNKNGTYAMVWFPASTLQSDFDEFLRALSRTRERLAA